MVDLELLEYLEGFISEARKARFIEVLEQRTNFITVAVEDVFQLHNTSAVIRSCEVFGIQQLHFIEGRFGERLDKNIAMGAHQWVDVHSHKTAEACMENLRDMGYKIIATSPHEDSCLLEDFSLTERTALFFGTEKEGLSEAVLKQADGFLKVPMTGFTESLNISVAAGIILQKLSSDLRKSDLNWKLSPTEILDKRLEWTKKSIKSIESIMDRYQAD
ncbi:TrmH family RNA methyltransferase [Poritiphilus flavus]|uniref:tRNA (guanosine(18)-2'-O)-methyltransferase n=1 Tax=Poritiphilus flavus TaxID=2697053 RepID=A0A6L9EBB5_9FLAO|nr:RNA methyltransferase [Poritiphilus flavus]NAS11709.1 TrmH family RNA methyltransferase [Poritiphilus flavus]